MVHLLREVGLDFVGAAPVRHVFARETTAPPEAVYTALAEDVPGWTQWYGAVTLARPLDGGARREIRLKGGARFEETVLAADYGVRRGDLLLAVDGRPVASAAAADAALSGDRELAVLRLLRPGRGVRHLALPLTAEAAERRPPGLPTDLGSGPL